MPRSTKTSKPVTQEWVHGLPMMQQSVLLTAIRGPDGMPKYGAVKNLLRWYRRCTLLSALDGRVLSDPHDPNGGSFTGPSLPEAPEDWYWEVPMDLIVDEYMRQIDGTPHHFHLHFMHGAQIIGYKHPLPRVRVWWANKVYLRLVHDMHLHPESEEEMDMRLGDNREGWVKRCDLATLA